LHLVGHFRILCHDARKCEYQVSKLVLFTLLSGCVQSVHILLGKCTKSKRAA
jgi:hypothetical protein